MKTREAGVPELKWYASAKSAGIKLTGPYASEASAYKSMRMTPRAQKANDDIWPPDLQDWPDDRTTDQILNHED